MVVVRGQDDLFEIVQTLQPSRRFSRRLNRRQQQRDQNADDRDDDQQFDEGKTAIWKQFAMI